MPNKLSVITRGIVVLLIASLCFWAGIWFSTSRLHTEVQLRRNLGTDTSNGADFIVESLRIAMKSFGERDRINDKRFHLTAVRVKDTWSFYFDIYQMNSHNKFEVIVFDNGSYVVPDELEWDEDKGVFKGETIKGSGTQKATGTNNLPSE